MRGRKFNFLVMFSLTSSSSLLKVPNDNDDDHDYDDHDDDDDFDDMMEITLLPLMKPDYD